MSCSKNISNIKWICLLLISRLKNLAHWNKSEVLPSLDASFISRFTAFLCLLSSNFLSKLLMDSKTVRIWSSIAGSISAETARLLNFWLYSAQMVIESITDRYHILKMYKAFPISIFWLLSTNTSGYVLTAKICNYKEFWLKLTLTPA